MSEKLRIIQFIKDLSGSRPDHKDGDDKKATPVNPGVAILKR